MRQQTKQLPQHGHISNLLGLRNGAKSAWGWFCVGSLCLALGCTQHTAKQPRIRINSWQLCHRPSLRSYCQPLPPRLFFSKARLRTLSFNVNYGGNIARARRAIQQAGADIVALQETTPEWETDFRFSFRKEYRYISFRHAPGAGGMGILSKYPIVLSKGLTPPLGGWFDGWLLHFQTPLGKVQMLNVHLRPALGEDGSLSSIPKAYFSTRPIRRRELQSHCKHFTPNLPTLVLGDFNEDYQGLALQWLRKHQRMQSALRRFDKTTPTWHWPTSYWTFRARLDHIFYSKQLHPVSAKVLPDAGSDHYPLLAEFRKVSTL